MIASLMPEQKAPAKGAESKSDAPRPDLISVDVLDDTIKFGCLREEWERLAERSPVSPFQTYDWSFLWWRYFGGARNRTLHILVFRTDEGVVGIAPLFLETRRLMGNPVYRRLRFLGCDLPDSPVSPLYAHFPLTDYFDFLVLPGHEEAVAETFIAYLEDQPNLYDEVQLVNLQRPGFLLNTFLPKAVAKGLPQRIHRSEICPRIILEGSFDDYMRSLDGNHRRRLRQAARASGEDNWYVIEDPQSKNGLQEAFADLVRLHQRRWNKMGSPGLFYDNRFRMFQWDIMNAFRERGWLWMKAVKAGGNSIAVRLGFLFKGAFYDYLSGVDDEVEQAKRRPGLALLVEALKDSIGKGARVVDLLRGGEHYKMQLANDHRYLWDFSVLNAQTVGSLRVRCVTILERITRLSERLMSELLRMRIFCHEYGTVRGSMRYAKERSSDIFKKFWNGKRVNVIPPVKNVEDIVRKPLERVRDRAPLAERILNSLHRDKNIPLTRKALKAAVYLRSLALSRLYLIHCDRVGKRCRTRGKPFVVNDGTIVIGNDFNLSSRIVRSELATGHKGAIEIGDDVSINFGALISSQHLVKIGSNVRVGPYSIITDSDFHTIGKPYLAPTGVPTIIEDRVWLGARVTVLKGSKIGKGSVISAGSVVTGEIPPNVIAAGVPARVVREALAGSRPVKSTKGSNGSVNSRIAERVTKVFRETFSMENPPELSWGPKQIARWDSLGHLNLILNLESEFHLRFSEEDMMRIVTVRDVCLIMEKYPVNEEKSANG